MTGRQAGDDGRRDEVARQLERLARRPRPRRRARPRRRRPRSARRRARRSPGPVNACAVARVADRQLGGARGEPLDQLVVDARRARSRASRRCTSGPRSRRRTRRCPAAAASRSAPPDTIAGFLPPISVIAGPRVRALLEAPAERPPDLGRAGEHDAVDRALGERAAGRARRRGRARRTPSGSPAAANASPTSAPDSGVCSDGLSTTVLPATSAPAGHARDERDREVERPDHAEHAERAQHAPVGLLGRELPERDLEAAVALDLLAVGLDQVDRLLHLGDRLGAALAGLERDRRRQLHVARARSRRRRGAARRSARRRLVRRHSGCAARPRSTASATSPAGASCARLATEPERLGSRRSNAGPSNDSAPPTTCGSGSAGPPRAASSAASNAASVSGAADPLV